MDMFSDDAEFTDIQMVQRVVDMFERRPRMQRIVRLGLLGIEYDADLDVTGDDDDDDDDDDYELDNWLHGQLSSSNNLRGYPRLPDKNDNGLRENCTRSHGAVCLPPLHYYTSAYEHHHLPSVKVQAKESDTERRARFLQEVEKSKKKTEKKRLKKQKQKERRRLERSEKETQDPVKNGEVTDDPQQPRAESETVNTKSKDSTNTSVQELAPAKDTDSSDGSKDESNEEEGDKDDLSDSEELDMTSTFVSKAAVIARRKLEQKPRPEKKKKIPIKEESKTFPETPNKDQDVDKKDSATPSSHTFEDNVKISTDLAVIGNRFASAGDYNMAVKYFTDAIKYNPTEFKLFGNRSFCFEKMQEYEKSLTDAELSLSMFPGWVKGLFRKGRALAGLKRYEESSQAFGEVLKLDSSCTEAAQELIRVQITQLMGYGYTWEQSSNALIIHGTVNRALEVLSKLNQQPQAVQHGTRPPVQVVNVTGTSPVLSANVNTAHPPAHPQFQEALKTTHRNKPLVPVQNMSNVQSRPQPVQNQATKTNREDNQPPLELFPVWVGNLVHPVTESMITNLFNKVGVVYSAKLLTSKRCAFVNFTKKECCDEAIQRFHGFELMGTKIAVRYPDRIPQGMGISKSALKADDLQDENLRHNEYADWRNAGGSQRPFRPYRHVPDHRGLHKY
ncbi:hypothetical protein PAMA_013922 [Pampus argenteus]